MIVSQPAGLHPCTGQQSRRCRNKLFRFPATMMILLSAAAALLLPAASALPAATKVAKIPTLNIAKGVRKLHFLKPSQRPATFCSF